MIKMSKLPKTYDFKRLNSNKAGYIIKDTPSLNMGAGGAIVVPPGVEDNFILCQGPLFNQDLSILTTTDGCLLVWK